MYKKSKNFSFYTNFFCVDRRKALTTAEILAELELASASDIPGTSVDVFISPPDDNGPVSDADSGDEDGCCDPDKMCGSQLRADAEVVVHDDRSSDSSDYSDSESSTEDSLPPAKKKRPETKKKPSRSWKKGDLQYEPIPPPSMPAQSSPSVNEGSNPLDFWQAFCSENIIDMIVKYTNLYAAQKNQPNFQVTPEEIYCVLAVLYMSGYVPVPRRRMYWELARDSHNELVSQAIRRNRFEEIFRFFSCM